MTEETLSSFWRHRRSSERPIALRDLQDELTYMARLILKDQNVQIAWHQDLLDPMEVQRKGTKTLILDSSPIDDIPEGQPIPDERVDVLLGDMTYRSHLEGLNRDSQYGLTQIEVDNALGKIPYYDSRISLLPRGQAASLQRATLQNIMHDTDIERILSLLKHLRAWSVGLNSAPAIQEYVKTAKGWKKDQLTDVAQELCRRVDEAPYMEDIFDLFSLYLIYGSDLDLRNIDDSLEQAIVNAGRKAFALASVDHPRSQDIVKVINEIALTFKPWVKRPDPPTQPVPQDSKDDEENEDEDGGEGDSSESDGEGQTSPDGTEKENEGEEPEGGRGEDEPEDQDDGDRQEYGSDDDTDSSPSQDNDASANDDTDSRGEGSDEADSDSPSDDEMGGDDEDGSSPASDEGMDDEEASGAEEADDTDDSDLSDSDDQDKDEGGEGVESEEDDDLDGEDPSPAGGKASQETQDLLSEAQDRPLLDLVDQMSVIPDEDVADIRDSIEFAREDISEEIQLDDDQLAGRTESPVVIWEKAPYNLVVEKVLREEAYQTAQGITEILRKFKRMRSRVEHGQETGHKLDKRRLGRVLTGDTGVWQKKSVIGKLDMSLSILLDSSSSVNNDQWALMLKTGAAFMQAAVGRDDLEMIVCSYTNDDVTGHNMLVRHFDRKLGKFHASRPYESGTPSAIAIAALRDSILKRLGVQKKDRIIVHVTDGVPNEPVAKQVEMCRKAGIQVFCVLVGDFSESYWNVIKRWSPYVRQFDTTEDYFLAEYGKGRFVHINEYKDLLKGLTNLFGNIVEVR